MEEIKENLEPQASKPSRDSTPEESLNLNSKPLAEVNLELEENIRKMKKKYSSSRFKKRLEILKTSYVLTYKSLNTKKIFLFWLSVILGFLFLCLTFKAFSQQLLISVPVYGGTLNEGILGIPRYVNPVLASSESDKDLTKLIFSGLLKKDLAGEIALDLASQIEKSEDGLTYTITLNNKATFQDGVKVTAEDILFTLAKIQDKEINSPLAINFEGVTVEKVDEETVIFHLKKPYIYFEESLTVGILPKHILGDLNNNQFLMSDFNTDPIGTGPFKISAIKKNNNIAYEYDLTSNRKNLTGRPFIDNFNIHIYQNNEELLKALNSGAIDLTSYLNRDYFNKLEDKNISILKSSLPNIFMLSFNPNKNNLLNNKTVRLFLAKAINKPSLLSQTLGGYYTQKDNFFGDENSLFTIEDKDVKALEENTEINLTTGDTEDLKKVANEIAKAWEGAGVKVNVLVYNLNELSDIIKNRDFQVLLFGNIIEKDTDLFAYWHSSSRNYPGLNITGYVSKNLDTNLDILKNSVNLEERKQALMEINDELTKEMPAIPLYSNDFNYVVKDKTLANMLQSQLPKALQNNSDRFLDVQDWYTSAEKVWRFSYKKNLIEKLSNILH